jgi:hypothetical protein|tara:strand:+ start:440 stop:2872 length:2433 start_codon:yes stop_codon:yes gene_type:complete
MPAVTQRIPNYLGGVSKQSDDKMLPGQVRECYNGFPDATYGLTKRPGFKHIANLGTGTTYDDAKWFFINRDDDEIYIGCIKGNNIYVWNAVTGVACTVTYGTGAQAYLSGTKLNYKLLTVQDTTIVINDSVTVAAQATPNTVSDGVATIVLESSAPDIKYYIKIQDVEFTVTAHGTDFSFDDVLTDKSGHNIKDAIVNGIAAQQSASNAAFNGTWTVTRNGNDSLDITRVVNGAATSFSIEARGGNSNSSVTAFQDEVSSVGMLPLESYDGHVVKIVNTVATTDDYFARFKADNGTDGRGFWEETISPHVSPGLDNTTMPHELINSSTNTFVFQKIAYDNRLIGDDTTNSHPSFVGEKITAGFFHNNRLGFLSKDNVIMSRSGKYYNFYFETAQTSLDSDPIDISCSSIIPTALYAVLPTAQGVILFSARQQFILFSDSGVLTPTLATIRAISNYEMDNSVVPVDVGTNINFISKTPGYTRVFSMVTKGQQQNPQVLDLSRVVKEWISPNIDQLVSSPQNSMIVLSSQAERELYIFRYYTDGEKNLMEAWTSWIMPGTTQFTTIDTDDMYAVTKQGNQVVLLKAALSQSPEQAIIVNNQGEKVNPSIDLYATASSVVYDATNKVSKCYLPYNDVADLTPVLIIKGDTSTGSFVESGFTVTPERASDGTGPYFIVNNKNLTSVASDVIVGFKYNFDVHLPTTYYRPEEKQTDFTANLTIARMKFSVGLSGVMSFKIQAKGRSEFTTTQPVIEANTYLANDVPLDNQNVFTVSIHQRTENFKLRMFNNTPFPVAINAMMWEGNYTPRFYRRK